MKLNERDKSHIRELAAQIEARTGIQILAVVTRKSDTYAEIPWKAFSFGTALAILALIAGVSFGAFWGRTSLLVWGIIVLGTGMVLALACIFLPPFARLFLVAERAAEETRQFAQSLFLERGLNRTKSRRAVLLLVSQFERRASIVADTGVTGRISPAELDDIAAATGATLARESASAALTAGLSVLEKLLARHGFDAADAKDEVPEEFLETEGPKS
jgi:putative membrane protein